jgi:hypothetical protein
VRGTQFDDVIRLEHALPLMLRVTFGRAMFLLWSLGGTIGFLILRWRLRGVLGGRRWRWWRFQVLDSAAQRLHLRLEVENNGHEIITAQVFELGTVHATRIPQRCKTAREWRE